MKLFAICTTLLFSIPLLAQEKINQEIVDAYLKEAGDHAALFYSPIETPPSSALWINHPFWLTEELNVGDIQYDGILYKNILMRINVASQNLVVATPITKLLVEPDMSKIEYFVLFNKRFEINNGVIECVEWEKGDLKLWHRLTKKKGADIVKDSRSYYSYDESNLYYVQDGSATYQVKKAKDVAKQYPQHKKQILKYVKDESSYSSLDKINRIIKALECVSSFK